MRVLFYQWNSFMNYGVEKALVQLGIEYDVLFYQQIDWEKDEGLGRLLERQLKQKEYTFVFSINFAPVVSDICQNKQILYVSWVYDAPLHIRNLEPLKNSNNRIFFFDRMQAEEHRKNGVNAFHMPLAGDIDSFGSAGSGYTTDISMVGKLYQTQYDYYSRPLTDMQRGYLDGILNAQSKVYGAYFMGELLDDTLLQGMNERYAMASHGKVQIIKEELEFMMACEITGRERYLALALLSNHYDVSVYSGDTDERLQNARFMGNVGYYEGMSDVFKQSKINLNISLKLIKSGIPLRVFDVLASGGFLLSNFQAEMPEYFSVGEDFVIYESIEDLYAKVDYYLKHESEREYIARHGQETIKKYYTFKQQMEKIIREALA